MPGVARPQAKMPHPLLTPVWAKQNDRRGIDRANGGYRAPSREREYGEVEGTFCEHGVAYLGTRRGLLPFASVCAPSGAAGVLEVAAAASGYSWEKTLVGENAEWKKPWLECRAVWVRLRLVRLHLDCLLWEWCTSVLGLNGR